jgi:cobaltochelatase CobN
MTAALVLISTADTDLLAARASGADWRVANPARLEPDAVAALIDGAGAVVVRLLGGRRTWPQGLDAVLASGLPVIALGGETTPDADLTALSTVPAGVAHDALRYLVEGGPDNLRELHRFVSDTVLLTGEGFEAPAATPAFGVHGNPAHDPAKATVGVVFYRAHALGGNTAFVDTLCAALQDKGVNALPVFVPSLREVSGELTAILGRCDALVVTVLAAGGTRPADAGAGGDVDAWSVDALAALDIPVIQGLCLTGSIERWADSDAALSPMDAAMQVAIPEFDGRLISVPFSFKQDGPDGIGVYVADPERAARVAGIAVGYARLRHIPNRDKRLAIVLSSYPTKHARVGNAVGLDTPASAVALIAALKDAGYDIGDTPTDGDALIHTLIAAGGHDVEWLTEEQLANAPIRVPVAEYRGWFDALDPALKKSMLDVWGEPPGTLYVDGDAIVLAGLRFGNLSLMIQPPRGFGENPIAIYHDPELAPSHHYLAAYRWMAGNVDAVVHLGKHGTLEWLPGKGLGLSAGCAPDAVLGNLPLVYPFIVNDPGEGTQAKRRAHATIIDHLVPPMARADTYGDMAKLEQLLDEYATVQALDPTKVPVVRAQIWTLIQAAQLHHDLHIDAQPDDDEFDEFVLHVDGYLCEIKDSQIRDGLHILGGAPAGQARVNLVLAVLRARQVWGGDANAMPGLRDALAQHVGLDEYVLIGDNTHIEVPKALTTLVDGPAVTSADAVDLLEALARRLVESCDAAGWAVEGVVADVLGAQVDSVERVLRFAADEVVPRLAATTDEITATLRSLSGGYVAAGPSGSPTRGLVNVLPTGRNFYSVDPKAIPSRNAWDTGLALADSLLARHVEDTGGFPELVGLTVWGTSAMRTQGDDIAEVLALIGCRPVWDDASRRVTGFGIVPLSELGRPRVDVTVRISGFFRDAFPHVITLLDDAITAVASLPEPDEDNYLAAHARADFAAHQDERRSTTRIFGSKPGAYGAGLLPLIDARNWRDDRDLAEVYAVWGGYAYGKGLDGRPARDDLETVYRRMSVAAKNVDTREHDIADSDDYFQYHGGMVAMVRSLRGSDPAAYIGDSHRPEQVKTRSLAEETKRVFRARVVNPRWIAAMQRHGYKGAFELAATVDYLFGYDATAGVVDDWMYEQLAASYVADPQVRQFMQTSNPWALRGIAERLLEAADRKLWAEPTPATLEMLREAYLAVEGDLEGE